MPERVFKPETKLKTDGVHIPATFPDHEFDTLERECRDLPIATEHSTVPSESHIVVRSDARSPSADRYRLTQIRLKELKASKNLKSLLITSPLPGDGKSTIALNLATALSEKGKQSVLLLEADVYRPTLVRRLGLRPWAGLTDCHKRTGDPVRAIRRIDPLSFYLLPAGQPAVDGDLLQSQFMVELMKALVSTWFDWIIIDSPPTTPIAEILLLRSLTDASLLVARAGKTPREAIEESIQNLGRDHVIGIMLNGVEGLDELYSKYYGYAASGPGRAGHT